MQQIPTRLIPLVVTISLFSLIGCSSAVNPWYDKNPKRAQSFSKRYTPRENRFIVSGGYAKQENFNPFIEAEGQNYNRPIEPNYGEVPFSQRKDLPPLAPAEFPKRQMPEHNTPFNSEADSVTESAQKRVDEQQMRNTYEGNGFYPGPKNLYQKSNYQEQAPSNKTRKKGENSSFKKLVNKVFSPNEDTHNTQRNPQHSTYNTPSAPIMAPSYHSNLETIPVSSTPTPVENIAIPDKVIELTPTYTEEGSTSAGYSYYDTASPVAEAAVVIPSTSEFDRYHITSIKPDSLSVFGKVRNTLIEIAKGIFSVKKAYANSAHTKIIANEVHQNNRSANLDVDDITITDIDEHDIKNTSKEYPQLKDTPQPPANIVKEQSKQERH